MGERKRKARYRLCECWYLSDRWHTLTRKGWLTQRVDEEWWATMCLFKGII